MVESFEQNLAVVGRQMNEELERLLSLSDGPERRVQEAMRYSSLDGGKRLRPFLVLQSAGLFNVSHDCALRVAAAIEMVHAYSLIHDDLPAMDNSDLRRGRPTCHKAFDEATAILAGDGLLTLAFELLAGMAKAPGMAPAAGAEAVRLLAVGAGGQGMVGGQMADLLGEGKRLTLAQLKAIHAGKTGA